MCINMSKHISTKSGEGVGGTSWELGTDMYTLLILWIKWIINEKLVYSSGNPTHWSVVT